LTVYAGLVGVAGAREGVSAAMLTRHSFGRQGSRIISAMVAFTLAGWYAYQVGFFGITINTIFPNAGFLTDPKIAGLWGGLLMMSSAYIGYRGLSIISNIAVPAIIITSLLGIVKSVQASGGWERLTYLTTAGDLTTNAAIVVVVGCFAVGGAVQADITRYSRSAKQSIFATFIGYMFAHSFVIMAGYIIALATGLDSLPAAMISVGLGIPALIVLIAGQWTTNDNNLYSSSLAFSNMVKIKKSTIVLILGTIATFIGVLGIIDYFVPWMSLLGVGFPPVAGIIIADYYILNKGKYDFGAGVEFGDFSRPAFIAWIISFALGLYIEWGIQTINSLVISFILYLVLMKLFESKNIKVFNKTYIEIEEDYDFR